MVSRDGSRVLVAFKGFEVFPERGAVFGHGFLGGGEPIAVDKVGEGFFVEDIVRVEGIAADLEVAAEVAGTDAVIGGALAVEFADGIVRILELLGSEVGDPVDHGELIFDGELVQLAHGLVAEGDLVEAAGAAGQRLGVVGFHKNGKERESGKFGKGKRGRERGGI